MKPGPALIKIMQTFPGVTTSPDEPCERNVGEVHHEHFWWEEEELRWCRGGN